MASKLVNFDDLYPGRFLKAGNLHGKHVTLTIASVDREELVGDDGKPSTKATMQFKETKLGLVLCKTNGLLIREMFGASLAAWVGRRVTIGPDTWNGEPCIRVMGGPDLATDCTCTVTLPRRKPFQRKLTKTAAPKAATEPAATREPGSDEDRKSVV